MKANEYKILCDCIERAVEYGYNRAFKHTDKPTRTEINNAMANAILNEICEYFSFEGDNHDETYNQL